MQNESIGHLIAQLAAAPESVRDVSPEKFERIIAEILASNGYEVQLTPATRDGGYDIMAVHKDALGIETTTVVECKRYAKDKKIPVSLVRGLYGVKSFLSASNALLVTTSDFSADARRLVDSKYDIQLIDYSDIVRWLSGYRPPVNVASYVENSTFHSCFISHSSKDKAFVEKLNTSLRLAGVRVWYAPEELVPGQKLREQIKKAINAFDKLVLVLSENSISSDWVVSEIRDARKREKEEGRQVLFPISIVPMERIRQWECFDSDAGKDIAVEIREYFIPDLSDWGNDAKFNAQVKKLLTGLQADDPRP